MSFCFSFDVRGRPFTKAIHWSDPNVFGPRAYFVTVSKPAALTLDQVTLNDEGIYRCRVDFRPTPTRNFAIKLTVIGEYPPSCHVPISATTHDARKNLIAFMTQNAATLN